MNAYQAQRIRFGILAARHTLARETMTPDQVDYLEGCEAVGWVIGDAGTAKAYREECKAIRRRRALEGLIQRRTREALGRYVELARMARTDDWVAKAHPDSIVGKLWPRG